MKLVCTSIYTLSAAVICLATVMTCQPCSATGNFFSRKFDGWHWYEMRRRATELEPAQLTPSEQIQSIRAAQEQALHQALAQPTLENLLHYLRAQKLVLDTSSEFTDSYQRAVQLYPEFNGTIGYPISQVGSQMYHAENRKNLQQTLQGATKRFGLFYFFKSGCTYCDQFDKVLGMLKNRYPFAVIKVSMTDQQNHPIAADLNVKAVPAVFLVDTRTESPVPISYGFVALDELEQRLHVALTLHQQGEQHGS